MVSKKKIGIVEELGKLTQEYDIIGTVNMLNLPAKQLQNMRENLRGSVRLILSRKTLLIKALKESKKKGLERLEEYMEGVPALIFTNESPFRLYKVLEKSKSSAPAKAGQEAPKDIIVKAAKTNFAPGPIIGELGAFGIKTKVEGGKLAIIGDTVVAKKGETISAELAGILKRLNIEPMEIGLNLTAVFEDGVVFEADTLAIDEDEYRRDIENANRWAINLAVESAYPAHELMALLISKLSRESIGLAREISYLCEETVESILLQAEAGARALEGKVGLIVDEEDNEEKDTIPKEEKDRDAVPDEIKINKGE